MPTANITRDFIVDMNTLWPLLIENGLGLASALIILVLGLWFSGKARKWTIGALRRMPHVDATLQGFFGSLVRYIIIIFTVLAVLAKFGVQTASLVALLGAAGLAVGLALQGTLSNVAAGVMLLIFRPFRAGQAVEVGGIAGTVKELTLFTTELTTADNIQIIVPNSAVWGQPVRNMSHHPTRRLELLFRVSYGTDLGRALADLQSVVDGDTRILKTPAPVIAVAAFSDISVDLLVRIWAATSDLEAVKFSVLRTVKDRFQASGIDIPTLPHMGQDGLRTPRAQTDR
ncbi:MAG: mechanosensitive ion channel domain-containing protein [Parvibaculum sp.]